MANVVKSGLFQKLGNRLASAHNKHKDDDTVFSGGGELPAGIDNGIAQLVECKFDQFKNGDLKGEYFFYAAGVVVSPTVMPDGLKVAGLRTSIMEPLCDTPNRKSRPTMDDHLEWIYNELRKLGVDTKNIDPSDLETVAAAVKEAQPHFSFRTWKGEPTKEYPNPRVNHQWGGLRDYNSESDPASGVTDDTEPESKPVAPATKQAKVATKAPPEPEPEFNEFAGDLDSLVEAAPEDQTAVDRLTEMALAAGVSQDDIDNAPDWEAVATMIREAENAPTDEEPEAEPEPEEFKPSVGDVYKYQPVDTKTKKPMVNPKTKKAVKFEVEITKVNEKAHTVELKNLDDGKTKYVGIDWDLLESAE